MPHLSVVIPVYNTEQYIWEAIESMLSQTFVDFELVIIDDGSTDGSWEIIQGYAKQDARITAMTRENRGIVSTRNELTGYCTTDYMCILDADDRAMPDRLEKQYAYMEVHPECAVVGSDTWIIDGDWHRTWYRVYPHEQTEIANSIFRASPLAQPATCIRLSAFRAVWWYQVWYERVEDYKLRCMLYTAGYTLHNLPERLTEYRVFATQWKSTHVKHTLWHTLQIQAHYMFPYHVTLWNLTHFLALCVLYLFPSRTILRLFKKSTYTSL